MTSCIRRAGEGDAAGVARLFAEMQENYGDPVPAAAAEEAAAAAIADPALRLLVAEADGAILGFAVVNPSFPARRLSRGLVLKDLYVAAAARGRGLGTALLRGAAALALAEGCTQLDWTTTSGNHGAARLYDRIARREYKIHFRLEGEGLAAAAKG